MHKARFNVRFTAEGEITAATTDIGKAKAEIEREVMRGVSISSALMAMMPMRLSTEVELQDSLVLPNIVVSNGANPAMKGS